MKLEKPAYSSAKQQTRVTKFAFLWAFAGALDRNIELSRGSGISMSKDRGRVLEDSYPRGMKFSWIRISNLG